MPVGNVRFYAMVLLATFSGCATFKSPTDKGTASGQVSKKDAVAQVIDKSPTPSDEDADSEEKSAEIKPEKTAEDIEKLTIDEVIRIEEPNTQNLYDNSRYDFPITINSRVEGWIDYFTGRGRPHMERYLARSSRYIPLMKQVLKKAGLPEDLVYLALIESGFNLRANSRARAVGPWQFVKGTGKRYGLRVDAWIDERRDPIRSTEAAAKYLKDLYLMFESWYLAASAYNAGEYKILRAIEQLKTNNYWRICQTRLLRRETKDYIPKLIAAAIIGKNPERYGFAEVAYQEPLEFETVTVDFPIQLKDIAKIVNVAEDDILDLNPELRRGMVPPDFGPYEVKVPVGSQVLVDRALVSMRTKLEEQSTDMPQMYKVRAGDTLNSVARRYRLAKRALANANNLSPRERLTPGTSLIIPTRLRSQRVAGVKETVSEKDTGEGYITHIVRRGESLWSISEKYNVTVQQLFQWNHLKRSAIRPGKRLRIRSGEGTSKEARGASREWHTRDS